MNAPTPSGSSGLSTSHDGGEAVDDVDVLVTVAARLNRVSAILLSGLEVPLTFRQYRTLTRVTSGLNTLRQLASRANLSIPTVSENIDGLVKRGLMETRPSEVDRRAITLHITPAGAAAAEAATLRLHDFVEFTLAGFTPDRRGELTQALQAVYDAATHFITDELGGNG